MLKDFVRERLMAAADEIFEVFERTIASYEEQLCRAREESERHRRNLEAFCNPSHVTHQQELPCIKQKEEDPEPRLFLKEEEEEANISEFQPPAEDDDEDEAPGWSPLHACNPGGDHQADGLLAPLSDGYDAKELWMDHSEDEDKRELELTCHERPGKQEDADCGGSSETKDDDNTSVVDPSASATGNAERSASDENEASPRKCKKRKRHPHERLRSQMKEARNQGKAYVNTRGIPIPKKNLVALPRHSCRHKCTQRVSEEERRAIFRKFWDLGNIDLQNAFICASVKLVNIQRRRPPPPRAEQDAADEPKNRIYSRKYSLTTGPSGHVEVCKTFFLATLCVSNGRLDRALQKHVGRGRGLRSPDGGGKHDNRKRLSDESLRAIKDHIGSFLECESGHARRRREDLRPGSTVAQMHRLYVEQCRASGREPEKEWVYRRIFVTEFQDPGKDAGCRLARMDSAPTERDEI
ncbi:uncharacterized protein LOC144019454 isoform X1 [Festucalex cinctus]